MWISEAQIEKLLTYEALIPAIRQALVDYSASRVVGAQAKVVQPLRMVMRVRDEAGAARGWFAVMPAIAGEVMGVKTVTFYPGNASLGLHTHMASIELLRRATGEPLAVMDGRLITEMRTAAVTAVAVEALARPGAKTLGILGSGVQARSHIRALRMVWPAFGVSGAVRVWGRSGDKAAALAGELDARAVGIEEAAGCDVVVTVTNATEPVLLGRWLAQDSLVVGVGAVSPQSRELDDEAMAGCLIAESRESAENESGDVILSEAKVFAEIGEVLAGAVALPEDGQRIFKSVGMAIEDVTAARLVWRALGNGHGAGPVVDIGDDN
jgi:thiomorpholine-carboxylate dehydrogenase